MAQYKNFFNFVLKWEGHFSKNTNDLAASGIPPDLKGVHTVYGVTWHTFQSSCKSLLNIEPTTSNFLNMKPDQAAVFFKNLYWDKILGDNITSNKVAYALVDFYWNSGTWATKNVQKMLNTNYNNNLILDGNIGLKSIAAINAINNNKLFEDILTTRINFLAAIVESRPNQKVNWDGWNNRIKDLRTFCQNLT